EKNIQNISENKKTYFTILQNMPGQDLADFIKKIYPTLKEDSQRNFLICLFLEVAQALSVFEDYGLLHGDLHTSNIRVTQMTPELQNEIQEGNSLESIKQRLGYFIQIFDFDRSVKTKIVDQLNEDP